MKQLFAAIPIVLQRASAERVQALIQMHRQDRLTGLLQMSYPSQGPLVMALLHGEPHALYRYEDGHWGVVPRQYWKSELNHPNATVHRLLLSVEALRVCKTFFEAWWIRTETLTLPSKELPYRLSSWALMPQPNLIHLSMDGSESLFVLLGNGTSILEGLELADGSAQFIVESAANLQVLADTIYQVARYESDGEQDVWREYGLRLALVALIRVMMVRFGELAGSTLAERLCAQLTSWCQNRGWDITVNSNGVVHRQFFDGLDEAIRAYASMLMCFRQEAGLAIGPRLAIGLSREALEKMIAHYRDTLERYVFESERPRTVPIYSQKERVV